MLDSVLTNLSQTVAVVHRPLNRSTGCSVPSACRTSSWACILPGQQHCHVVKACNVIAMRYMFQFCGMNGCNNARIAHRFSELPAFDFAQRVHLLSLSHATCQNHSITSTYLLKMLREGLCSLRRKRQVFRSEVRRQSSAFLGGPPSAQTVPVPQVREKTTEVTGCCQPLSSTLSLLDWV